MTDAEVLPNLIADLKIHIPGLEIRYKDESKFMKLLGFLLRPINPLFMTYFTTTIGTTVYYPSRAYVARYPVESVATLAHEFVHLSDEAKEGSIKYKHSYLSPQVYFVPTLVAYCALVSIIPILVFLGGYALSCLLSKRNRYMGWGGLFASLAGSFVSAWLFSGWLAIGLLFAALLPLAPFPSVGRTRLEVRGYAMTVAAVYWLTGQSYPPDVLDQLRVYFNGPAYYFMSWSPSKISSALTAADVSSRSGSLAAEVPYSIVYESLKKHGRLRAS